MTALALGVALTLSGCETATAIKDKTVEYAIVAGTYISDQATKAGDFVMGRQSGSLVDDGTSCFATERVAFYAAVDDVTAAQRLEYAAIGGAAVATFVAIYADSIVAKIAAVGFAATMVGVIASIEADNERITAVNKSFDSLVRCRQQDAKRINQDYGKRKLDRAAAQDQLANLRTLMAADVQVAQGVNTILTVRNDGYDLSTKQVEEQAPKPKDSKEVRERTTQTAKAKAAIQTNQTALRSQTASIDQAKGLSEGKGGFELSWLKTPWLTVAALAAN